MCDLRAIWRHKVAAASSRCAEAGSLRHYSGIHPKNTISQEVESLAKLVYHTIFRVPIFRKPSPGRHRLVPVRVQKLTMSDFASPSNDTK